MNSIFKVEPVPLRPSCGQCLPVAQVSRETRRQTKSTETPIMTNCRLVWSGVSSRCGSVGLGVVRWIVIAGWSFCRALTALTARLSLTAQGRLSGKWGGLSGSLEATPWIATEQACMPPVTMGEDSACCDTNLNVNTVSINVFLVPCRSKRFFIALTRAPTGGADIRPPEVFRR